MTYILYNPLSGKNEGEDGKQLAQAYEDAVLINVTRVEDYHVFFNGLAAEDIVILCGGDGTLNRFANDIRGIDVQNTIYFYATGSGNDFARDLGHERLDPPTYGINEELRALPTVKVGEEERVFVNGVGYGIDGYCCEKGDELREKRIVRQSHKPINYTSIAVRGLLFDYHPHNATVVVDGTTHTFKKVWLAPVMHGRYYGGGMMPTPAQDRYADEKTLSVMVFHDVGKFRTLMIFPSLFQGEHVKNEGVVTILTGKSIAVSYDRPAPLQIDGETVKNVKSFTATAVE